MREVLVVDDEQQVLVAIHETLKRRGYSITTAGSGLEAVGKLKKNCYHAVLTDVRMPELDGMDLLREVKRISPTTPVIFLSGHGSVAEAVSALKQGIFDYLIKPFSAQQLAEVVAKATEFSPDEESPRDPNIHCKDLKMKQLLKVAGQVALSDATVLIEAESGTGKELLARYIHNHSPRVEGPFVAVNCAAVPEELLESELFGHEKGAFTGALRKKPGKFEVAHRGTILLDEVGEMSPLLQAKLLRVLQEGKIDRVGGTAPLQVEVRVIATTNRNLKEAMQEGDFRRDLFYRLNVIPLTIPPLRERKSDIPLLVDHFCQKYETQGVKRKFAGKALDVLQTCDWPGNVRELENVTRRALALCKNPVISPADLLIDLEETPSGQLELRPGLPLKELEKRFIQITLQETGGHRTRAAEMLGISLRTLRNRIREYRTEGEDW